jgi:3-deoxy-D-manno-octulosonic-acid transferase
MVAEQKARLTFFIYNLVWVFISLPFLLLLCWRYRQYSSHRRRYLERFSLYLWQAKPQPFRLWIHLASVGEVMAAIPLLKLICEEYDQRDIVVTTTTPTGEQALKKYLQKDIQHYYLPFDFAPLMKRFVGLIQAKCLIIFETEVWPSMIMANEKVGTAVVLANARLSEKSKNNYQRFKAFSQLIFGKIVNIAAQTKADEMRFIELGAKNTTVTGNIKSEIKITSALTEKSHQLRTQWLIEPGINIMLAASTHQYEEELILSAFKNIQIACPNTLLIIVPRHPERFDLVEKLCLQQGFNVVRKSLNNEVNASTEIVLGDTVGELLMLFGVCDVAIMGGTFIEWGGHNFLEPAAWSLPIVSGKSDYNFMEIAKGLVSIGALKQVDNVDDLSATVIELLKNPQERKKRGLAAKQFVNENRGALEKTLRIIQNQIKNNQ